MQSRVLTNSDLVPPAWHAAAAAGVVCAFNPAIIDHGPHLLMAYRVVLADGVRRIAMCRLDHAWTVIPASVRPTSDLLTFQTETGEPATLDGWLSDPRLAWLSGRLFMHFNTGSNPRPNRMYLVEIDPATLSPAGPARIVLRDGERRAVEKNWLFFQSGDDVYTVYQMGPVSILKVDLSHPHRVMCTQAFRHEWDVEAYVGTYGELRGGASPVLRDGRLHLVAHSLFAARPDAGLQQQLVYVGSHLVLSGSPPFQPIAYTPRPSLMLTADEQALAHLPRLDPRCLEAAYPAGAVADADGIVVSYGVNERYAALRRMPWAQIDQALVPAIRRSRAQPLAKSWWGESEDPAHGKVRLRAFWWNQGRRPPRSPPGEQLLGRFVDGNFGDMAAPHILGRLTGMLPDNHTDSPRLLTIGSIIQAARDGDVIWGAGMNGARGVFRHAPRRLHAYATRGPISYDFLRRGGFDVSRVTAMFDPVSLVPHLFADELATMRASVTGPPGDFILVPHYRDDQEMRRRYPEYQDRIVSADTPFLEMARIMLRSSLVISSSLHGLILAEALGVPAVWHRPLMGEDELKFTDYYLGTNRHRIVRVETVRDAFKASVMPLPVFDHEAMVATFPPRAELEALGILTHPKPLARGRTITFATVPPDPVMLRHGWSDPEGHGIWTDGIRAAFDVFVGDAADRVVAEMGVMAYVPSPDHPQQVVLSTTAGEIASFRIDDGRPSVFRFAIQPAMLDDGVLHLTLDIPGAVAPASVGAGGDRRRLGIALTSFRLQPIDLVATADPALRLLANDAPIAPAAVDGRVHRFDLPGVDGPVALLSRAGIASEGMPPRPGLAIEDRRVLGVGVARIAIVRDGVRTEIPMDDPGLTTGWWGVERTASARWRWTSGPAVLPIPPGGPVAVEITVLHTISYALDPASTE